MAVMGAVFGTADFHTAFLPILTISQCVSQFTELCVHIHTYKMTPRDNLVI